MPCVRGRNCPNPNPGAADSFTFRGTQYWLCANHQNNFDQVMQNQPAGTAAELQDAKKLFIATSSKTLFDDCMRSMVRESARRVGNAMTWRWRLNHGNLHLSKELTFYEHQCWFGEQQKIFSGLLSAQEFLQAMANGYMVKDPGPGPNHGEFSHRLQWHVLMRVMTDDFRVAKTGDWNMSPLQLFCWTGTTGYWGAALEGNGQAGGGPGSPNWVDERLRTHEELSKTTLGRALEKKRNKRLELQDIVASCAEAYERRLRRNVIVCHDGSYSRTDATYRALQGNAVGALANSLPNSIVVDMTSICEILYAWKKIGGPRGPVDARDHAKAIASQAWWQEARAMRNAGAATDPGRDNYQFEQLPNGTISTGSLLQHSSQCLDGDINQRKLNSTAQLRR